MLFKYRLRKGVAKSQVSIWNATKMNEAISLHLVYIYPIIVHEN